MIATITIVYSSQGDHVIITIGGCKFYPTFRNGISIQYM